LGDVLGESGRLSTCRTLAFLSRRSKKRDDECRTSPMLDGASDRRLAELRRRLLSSFSFRNPRPISSRISDLP
jgi:hypothetical protein